jgi:glutamyl-tRNA synthetase
MTLPRLRVRFAPSPTGYLHIGGARTALFNWLYARRHGGTFVLRIEDTDQARSTEASLKAILESMRWLGLDWDEGPDVGGPHGPYKQTERTALYKEYADRMVASGTAYRCYATKEELDALRKKLPPKEQDRFVYPHLWRDKTPSDWLEGKPYVYRFKTPLTGDTSFKDEIFGTITTPNSQMQDFILLRSDGIPLYNFGVVIDDLTMGINLVARGSDHIINTPPQVLIYKALGAELPRLAHLPMMLAPDGKKLSKREGRKYGIPISVTKFFDEQGPLEGYRELGYSPDAVLNIISRFGWSHGDQETFTRQELIDLFDFADCSKADGKFDIKKSLAITHKILKDDRYTTLDACVAAVEPFLRERGLEPRDQAFMRKAVATVRERARTYVEMAEALDYYLRETPVMDAKASAKLLTPAAAPQLRALRDVVAQAEPFDAPTIEAKVAAWLAAEGLQIKDVAQAARVALTGRSASPGLFEVIEVLGREVTAARLEQGAALAAANTTAVDAEKPAKPAGAGEAS